MTQKAVSYPGYHTSNFLRCPVRSPHLSAVRASSWPPLARIACAGLIPTRITRPGEGPDILALCSPERLHEAGEIKARPCITPVQPTFSGCHINPVEIATSFLGELDGWIFGRMWCLCSEVRRAELPDSVEGDSLARRCGFLFGMLSNARPSRVCGGRYFCLESRNCSFATSMLTIM